jgi:phosphinothricin acetyltransferase
MKIRKFVDSDALSTYLIVLESLVKEVSKYYSKKVIWLLNKDSSPKIFLNKKGQKKIKLVAEHKKEIVGYTSASLKQRTAMIGSIYISPEFIGKGIGTKLYRELESILKEKGIKKIQTNSSISPYTVKFYRNNGFTVVKRIKTKIGNVKNVPVVLMEKEL